MDVNHCIAADSVFGFVTKDFVKPTSIGRSFIHGSSHHPPSTFKSIIFEEAIRLRRLHERKEDYLASLNRLQNKAKKSKIPVNMTSVSNSGFPEPETRVFRLFSTTRNLGFSTTKPGYLKNPRIAVAFKC